MRSTQRGVRRQIYPALNPDRVTSQTSCVAVPWPFFSLLPLGATSSFFFLVTRGVFFPCSLASCSSRFPQHLQTGRQGQKLRQGAGTFSCKISVFQLSGRVSCTRARCGSLAEPLFLVGGWPVKAAARRADGARLPDGACKSMWHQDCFPAWLSPPEPPVSEQRALVLDAQSTEQAQSLSCAAARFGARSCAGGGQAARELCSISVPFSVPCWGVAGS